MTKTTESINSQDQKELAYLYDVYVAPHWREPFDQIIDEELTLPREGKMLDVHCGTGGFALGLASKVGGGVHVVGIDENDVAIALANGKLEVSKLDNINFRTGKISDLELASNDYDFISVDLSLFAPATTLAKLAVYIPILQRIAKPEATVTVRLATKGSFDEFYSFYWQTLYELGWEEYTARVEPLIQERLSVEQAELLMKESGFRKVESFTRKQRFDHENATAFLTSPMITTYFMDHWLSILPADRIAEFKAALTVTIDRECGTDGFDFSSKNTLLVMKR